MQQLNHIVSELRPYRPSDLQDLVELLALAGSWPPSGPPSGDDFLFRLKRRNIEPQSNINILPGPNGKPIASIMCSLFRENIPRLAFELTVHPYHRRQGIGSSLFRFAEEKAQILGAAQMSTSVFHTETARNVAGPRFLERHQFSVQSSYWQMRVDDLNSQPAPQWPQGLGYRKFDGSYADAERWARLVREAFNEHATPDMVMSQLREPGCRPDGYFFGVDTATGEEVGTSRARIDRLGGAPFGYVGTVGVLPAYRRRGIARALVLLTLGYLREVDMPGATLFVETGNSSARRLYSSMGWRPIYRSDHYSKSISPESKAT